MGLGYTKSADVQPEVNYAGAWNDAGQSINTASQTALTYTIEEIDGNAMVNLGTNNDRITIKAAGRYLILGQVWVLNLNVACKVAVYIDKNGTPLTESEYAGCCPSKSTTSLEQSVYTMAILDLALNDYIRLQIYHNKGSAHTFQGRLNIIRIA